MATMGYDVAQPPPTYGPNQMQEATLRWQAAQDVAARAARARAMGIEVDPRLLNGGDPIGPPGTVPPQPAGANYYTQQVPRQGALPEVAPEPAPAPPPAAPNKFGMDAQTARMYESQRPLTAAEIDPVGPPVRPVTAPAAAPPPVAPVSAGAGAGRGALSTAARALVNPTTAKIARFGKSSLVGALGTAEAAGLIDAAQTPIEDMYKGITGYDRPADAGFWGDLGIRTLGTAQKVGDAVIATPGQIIDTVRGAGDLPNKAWNWWNDVVPAKTPEQMKLDQAARKAAAGMPGASTMTPQFSVAGEPPGPAAPGAGGKGGALSGGAAPAGQAVPGGEQPSALGSWQSMISKALEADPEQQKAASDALDKARVDIDSAFKKVQDANGVPDEIAKGLSREEKGMLLMQFGLTVMGTGGRPGVNGLTAAAYGGQAALSGYGNILDQRRADAKEVAQGKVKQAEGALTQAKTSYEMASDRQKALAENQKNRSETAIKLADLGEKIRSNTATEAEKARFNTILDRHYGRSDQADMLRAQKGEGGSGGADKFGDMLFKQALEGGGDPVSQESVSSQLHSYATSHGGELPDGWIMATDPSNKPVFYHEKGKMRVPG